MVISFMIKIFYISEIVICKYFMNQVTKVDFGVRIDESITF